LPSALNLRTNSPLTVLATRYVTDIESIDIENGREQGRSCRSPWKEVNQDAGMYEDGAFPLGTCTFHTAKSGSPANVDFDRADSDNLALSALSVL
jgi:hypothetical protein